LGKVNKLLLLGYWENISSEWKEKIIKKLAERLADTDAYWEMNHGDGGGQNSTYTSKISYEAKTALKKIGSDATKEAIPILLKAINRSLADLTPINISACGEYVEFLAEIGIYSAEIENTLLELIKIMSMQDSSKYKAFIVKEAAEKTLKELRLKDPLNNTKDVGGIDMNTIELNRQGEGEGIQFDMTGMEPLLNMDIQGFTPVIIDITPINSVLPILGLADPTEPTIKFGTEEAQEALQLSSIGS